jgi:Fe2+ transport system protein FeoA
MSTDVTEYRSLKLSDFRGQRARIVRLDLPDAETHRLQCLGVFEGQLIQLLHAGSPLILIAAGSRVAIARDIVRRILVQPVDDQAA